MTVKTSISLTDDHARIIQEAVASGDYASTSEVVREALRDWRARQEIGRLWDEGMASGFSEADEPLESILAEVRDKVQ
jgi:antitoxin ParD1/3/4